MIAAAAATVLVLAGVAVAAYLTYLAPEDAPRTPQATLDAPDPAEQAGPKPAPPKPQGRRLRLAPLRLLQGPPALLRAPGLLPRPVPGRLEAQGPGAARVPARDGARVDLPARRQRPAGVAAQEDRQGAVEEEARAARRVGPRARRRARLRDAAGGRPRRGPRARRRAAPAQRQAALVAHAAEPQRVLAAAARRARLLRHRERDALLPRRRQRQGDLDLPRGGRDQGQPDARPRQAVLRRLRRARPGRARVQRPPRVVGGRRGADLRDRGGRRRQGLPRQPVGARLRLLDAQSGRRVWSHAHRELRLCVGGGERADRVRRLLRRPLLRAARPHRAASAGPTTRAAGSPARRR